MTRSFFALLIVVELVVIIFLIFQVQDNNNKHKDNRMKDQDRITKAARLIVQSATQSHPLFAHVHAMEAKIILDDIIDSHGGLVLSEKNLKFPKGKLEALRVQIYEHYNEVQSYLMEQIIEKHPKFDLEINDAAGLRNRKKSSRVTRRHRKER